MNLWKQGLLFIAAIMVLSGCDKKIDILKNPNIPTYPTQSTYDGVGLFTAYTEGTLPPPNVMSESATDSTMAVLAVYGIDKSGQTTIMKDQEGNRLTERSVVTFQTVKSGLLFSTIRDSDGLLETFFTSDGKSAIKVSENFVINSINGESSRFKVPEQKDYEYFCNSRSQIFQWNDKQKTLTEISFSHTFSSCLMFSDSGSNFVATYRSFWEEGGGFTKLTEIKTSADGEVSFNQLLNNPVNMFSSNNIYSVLKIKDSVYVLSSLMGMGPPSNKLSKIDPETKVETLISNFSVMGSYYNGLSTPFGKERVNGKFYIIVNSSVSIPETAFPIEGDVDPDSNWTTTSADLAKIYSLDSDGNFVEEFSDSKPFTRYFLMKSGDQVYVSQEREHGIANGVGYDSITDIELYNLAGEKRHSVTVNPGYNYRLYSIGSNSVILVYKNNLDDSFNMKYYIPSALAGGEMVTNSVFENFNLRMGELYTYYGKVMFSIQKMNEDFPQLGLVNSDGSLNTFSQIGATIGGGKLAR